MSTLTPKRSLRTWTKNWLKVVYDKLPLKAQRTIRVIVKPPRHKSRYTNVFHCTTQKAGSQWIRSMFSDRRIFDYSGFLTFDYEASRPGGFDPRGLNQRDVLRPFPENTIATPLYIEYSCYKQIPKPEGSRAIFVIRDPRDLVVSEYFSMRYSHVLMADVAEKRARLESLSVQDGLAETLNSLVEYGTFCCQRSWLAGSVNDDSVLSVRFEDLAGDKNLAVWQSVFRHFDIQLPTSSICDLLREYSFEALTGRKRGIEDKKSHLRKGLHGDWKNYFDDGLSREFKKATGDLVVVLGYESDATW